MLHVHVLRRDGVIACEPGDPDKWIELETTEPGLILDHFRDLAPVTPRIMHVTFGSGEFSADSGSELVVDTLDVYSSSSSSPSSHVAEGKGKMVRVWASGSKVPLARSKHQHAKPARMMAAGDLVSLRARFLDGGADGGGGGLDDRSQLELCPVRDGGGGGADVLVETSQPEEKPVEEKEEPAKFVSPVDLLHDELADMRKVFVMKTFGSGRPIMRQEDLDPALAQRLTYIETELGQGQFGPLVTFEPGAKVYKQQKTDESGSVIRAVKIKPLTMSDTQGNLCLRNNTIAVVDYPDGSRMSEEVLQTKKIGEGYHEYAHLKNTKKSKRFSSNVVCWCKQEYKHKVPDKFAPGSMNVDPSFDYLLNSKLLEQPENKVESYMDDEGRAVRKTKRMQKGVKRGPNGEQEDCWTSWVIKETKDPLDGGWLCSNKQRETRMSRKMLHHILHNVVKTKAKEGAQLVTTVTILVVHRMEPYLVPQNDAAAPDESATCPFVDTSTYARTLKDLHDVLDSLGADSDDEGEGLDAATTWLQPGAQDQPGNGDDESPTEMEIARELETEQPSASVDVESTPFHPNEEGDAKNELQVKDDDEDDNVSESVPDAAETAPAPRPQFAQMAVGEGQEDRAEGGEVRPPPPRDVAGGASELPCRTSGTARKSSAVASRRACSTLDRRPGNKTAPTITINIECQRVGSTSGASESSRKLSQATRALSGDEEYGDDDDEECPPDDYDLLLDEVNRVGSPDIPDAEVAEMKRRKVQEELKKRWSNTVARISLGELFLSMPRTTRTVLHQAHTELAQAKMAAMALRYNYGVQEAEQNFCPTWCSRRTAKRRPEPKKCP